MVDPHLGDTTPTMMICGNYPEAKLTVRNILIEFGWEDIVDVGDIEGARYLEAMCALWVRISAVRDTYQHAFRDITNNI
jgi:hypothetical protein